MLVPHYRRRDHSSGRSIRKKYFEVGGRFRSLSIQGRANLSGGFIPPLSTTRLLAAPEAPWQLLNDIDTTDNILTFAPRIFLPSSLLTTTTLSRRRHASC